MTNENVYKWKDLKIIRQRLSIKLYGLVYIIGLLGASASIISNPLNTGIGKIKQLLPVTIVILFSLLILFILYKKIGKVSWIDKGIFLMTVFLYIIIVGISIGKILSVVIWIPMFVVFLFALMNINLSYIFLTIHLLVIISYNLTYPEYEYFVTKSTYASMYTIILILFVSVPKVINLFLDYQKKIYEDNEMLIKKNEQVSLLLKENEEKNLQLTEIAYHDSLTGLLNRRGFIKTLDKSLNNTRCNSFFVLLIDIAQFRNINNVYGYDFGDKVLKTMAKMLNETKLERDYIARIGNDIFAVVIKNISIEELKERIYSDFSNNYFIEEHGINIKYRIGIASYECGGKNAATLLKEADIALSKTKELQTVNYYIYDNNLDIEFRDRFNMLLALEKAVESKEIVMVYQPIYNQETGEIISVEALARWEDEKFGAVPPDMFIKLAEKTSLIHVLGSQIIENACRFAKKLKDDGFDYTVTINISYRQLELENFAELFIEELRKHDLNPNKMGIEITETVLIDNFDLVVEHLNRLRNNGVAIYLDDFGTGYSSLNYLDKLPIDVLKIDKQFVDEILANPRKLKLLGSIASLARKFDLRVVAEGVETNEQVEILKSININLIQGYFYSRPLMEEEILLK